MGCLTKAVLDGANAVVDEATARRAMEESWNFMFLLLFVVCCLLLLLLSRDYEVNEVEVREGVRFGVCVVVGLFCFFV